MNRVKQALKNTRNRGDILPEQSQAVLVKRDYKLHIDIFTLKAFLIGKEK